MLFSKLVVLAAQASFVLAIPAGKPVTRGAAAPPEVIKNIITGTFGKPVTLSPQQPNHRDAARFASKAVRISNFTPSQSHHELN